MSKSLGNYVAIHDAPEIMFGKLMSISDELMWRYFELLSFRPLRGDCGIAPGRGRRAGIRATSSSNWRAKSSRVSIRARPPSVRSAISRRAFSRARFRRIWRSGLMRNRCAERTPDRPPEGSRIRRERLRSDAQNRGGRGARQSGKNREPQHELLAGNTYIVSVGKRSFAKIRLVKARLKSAARRKDW